MTLSPGTRLGPHEILSLLGAGGIGEVYRASGSDEGVEPTALMAYGGPSELRT
jgi:hypothetical protein